MSRFSRPSVLRILTWAALAHAAVFLLFWLTNGLFYSSTNDFLADALGARMDYIRMVLLVAALLGTWSTARLVTGKLRWTHSLTRFTGYLYGFFAAVFLLFFYGSFGVLFHEDPVQLPRLIQLVGYFRLVPDTALFFGLVLLLKRWQRRPLRSLGRITPAGVAVLLGVCGWGLPLVFPPGSVYRGTLPQKPLMIAHRGASMVAPENTLAAAERAASLGVYGLETDIHISQDGVLFLMHDDTLERTTNVTQVFPGREKERAENFTLAEVRRLNAGQWFVDQDPFQAIAYRQLSAQQMEGYRGQFVPTLAEELDVVRRDGLIFIFDLNQPPAGSAYYSAYFDLCLKKIQQAGIDPQVWFLVDRNELTLLRKASPQMKPTYGMDYRNPPPAAELKAAGYQIVNGEYALSPSWIRQYQAAGLWVNLYTVDEPWQFSRLWLTGVNSITTSNAQELTRLTEPVLGMPFAIYSAVWIIIGATGALLVLLPGRAGRPAVDRE